MRFRVDVSSDAAEMSWSDVHAPARGVVYDLIRAQDEALAAELHDKGWAGAPLRPLGICPPRFARPAHGTGGYGISAQGRVWVGSPVPRIAACLLGGVATRTQLRWGGTVLGVRGVQVETTPEHGSGTAVFETASPVVVKHEDRFVLPEDARFTERLVHNLRHRADVLDMPNEVEVEVVDSGPRRRFETGKGGFRIGARATVRVSAHPRLLDAVYDGGLGLATVQGFGWVK